jgi:hypothetical protein
MVERDVRNWLVPYICAGTSIFEDSLADFARDAIEENGLRL